MTLTGHPRGRQDCPSYRPTVRQSDRPTVAALPPPSYLLALLPSYGHTVSRSYVFLIAPLAASPP